MHRDLTGIDWAETPLAQAEIETLATAAFMETAQNLILVGDTGTGKTHVSTAVPDPRLRGKPLVYRWVLSQTAGRGRRAGLG